MMFLISGKTVNLLKLKYTFIFYIETHTVSNVRLPPTTSFIA